PCQGLAGALPSLLEALGARRAARHGSTGFQTRIAPRGAPGRPAPGCPPTVLLMTSRRLLLSLLCAACALVVGLVVWLATGSGGAAVDGVGGSAVTGAVASSSPRPSTFAEKASEERSDSSQLADTE